MFSREFPLNGQGRCVLVQADEHAPGITTLAITGPRDGLLAAVNLPEDQASAVSAAILAASKAAGRGL